MTCAADVGAEQSGCSVGIGALCLSMTCAEDGVEQSGCSVGIGALCLSMTCAGDVVVEQSGCWVGAVSEAVRDVTEGAAGGVAPELGAAVRAAHN